MGSGRRHTVFTECDGWLSISECLVGSRDGNYLYLRLEEGLKNDRDGIEGEAKRVVLVAGHLDRARCGYLVYFRHQ